MSSNTPCTEPERCGVKSHRPGTQADCMRGKQGSGKQGGSQLSATPALASPSTPEPGQLSNLAQAALDNSEFAESYFKNNYIGQYLDQILEGKGVDQLEEPTELDYATEDDQVELLFGIDEEDQEDWEHYEPAIEELDQRGKAQALDWIKQNAGTDEFSDYIEARVRWNRNLKRATKNNKHSVGPLTHSAQLSWAEDPLNAVEDEYED